MSLVTCSTSKSQHENALEKLYRICGEISSVRNNKFFNIEEHKSDMDVSFNTTTIYDIPGVHHNHFSIKCKNIVKNCKKRNTVSKLTPITWFPHQIENCMLLSFCENRMLLSFCENRWGKVKEKYTCWWKAQINQKC